MTENTADTEAGSRFNVLKIAIWGTAIYVAVFLVSIAFLSPADRPAGFAGVAALTVNEFGDLLAGAFAPIAFLWLVTAVIIQSQELAAQREELRETRRVSEKNVEFIGEQTRLSTIQTDLLVSEEDKVRERESDERFAALIEEAADIVSTNFKEPFVIFSKGLKDDALDDGHQFTFSFVPQMGIFEASPKQIIGRIAENSEAAEKVRVLGGGLVTH